MSNPFEEILQELRQLKIQVSEIGKAKSESPNFLSFPDYCKREGITRPTGYKRAHLGLIQLEKIGGRQYVLIDSIKAVTKYQRREALDTN